MKPGNVMGQSDNNDMEKILPKVHSIYIYHLSKYFLWPQSSNQENFIIGVLGNKGMSADISIELKALAQERKANGQEIIIKHFDTPQNISLDCHILYLPYESSNVLSEVLMKTQDHPILVITAKEGLGKVGSPVNFITVNGKVAFELNEDAVEKRHLKFTQQLKAIATLI